MICHSQSVLIFMALFLLNCQTMSQDTRDAVPTDPQFRWFKGNIHTHSLWSDGNDFPEMISEWYRTHDYNFLAISDHNILAEGPRWFSVDAVGKRGGKDALEKYEARFGGGWVETRGEIGTKTHEVRLKPLNEYRALLEERGKFILLQGEEISDRFEKKPIHMNATNIKQLIRPLGGQSVVETINNNLRAAEDQASKTGREIMVHLNHPNFGYGVTAEELAQVVSEQFFEVYNGHPGIRHLGDEDHPSVERLWDIANTIRISQLNAAPLMGVGTDDSHKYHGTTGSRPGRGWIMVRSKYLTPDYLIKAVKRGDFYASSGVTLSNVSVNEQSDQLQLVIEPEDGTTYKTQFIGTPVDYERNSNEQTDKDANETESNDKEGTVKEGTETEDEPHAVSKKYSPSVGKVLAEVAGLNPSYQLTGKELYVRAVVTASKKHHDPSFADQDQQAWTQPVGWQKHLESESGESP